MGSTNRTYFAKLSQFTRSDKPTWTGDYNGDMSRIDRVLVALDNTDKTLAAELADSRTGPMLNVLDFGAKGDGVTDDRAAIQKAFDVAAKRIVLFPPGVYVIDGSAINCADGMTILGYGATIQRGPNAKASILTNYPTSDHTTTAYNGRSNITILGLTVDSMGDAPTSGDANLSTFNHARNITVRDCTFRRPRGTHGLELNSIDVALVDNCIFEGYVPSTLTQKEAIQIDCALPGSVGSGAEDGTMARNITVRDCTFRGYGALPAPQVAVGSHSASVGQFYDRIHVTGIKVNGPTYAAVRGYSWRDSTIERVTGTLDPNAAYGVRVQQSTRCVVSDVVLSGMTAGSVLSVASGSDHVTVSSSVVDGGAVGVSVNTATACSVNGVTSRRASSYAVAVDAGTDTLVTGCVADGAGYPSGSSSAFRVSDASGASANTSITGCKSLLHGAGTETSAGVSVAATATNTWVFGNDFRGLAAATVGTVTTTTNRI